MTAHLPRRRKNQMAKIEAEDVLEAIEKRRKNCLECSDSENEYSAIFSEGYLFALEHIEQIVNVLKVGAELMEKIKKGEKI